MSNLTNYKETLQEHNVKLQQAIDKTEALPDAGGVNIPELITINYSVNDNYIVKIDYIGVNNDTNTLEKMSATGNTGTFQCLSNQLIEIATEEVENGWGDKIYPPITNIEENGATYGGFYVGGNGTDHSITAIHLLDSVVNNGVINLSIECGI